MRQEEFPGKAHSSPRYKPHQDELSFDFEGEAENVVKEHNIHRNNRVVLVDGNWTVDGVPLPDWLKERQKIADLYKVVDLGSLNKKRGCWYIQNEEVRDNPYAGRRTDPDSQYRFGR
jgi:hypothetical protein